MTLRRKVVEDVAFSKGSKREEARERHCEAGYERDKGAVMCYSGEAVDGRRPERTVDEERVMVTDKRCWRTLLVKRPVRGQGSFVEQLKDVVPNEMTPTAWKKPLLTKSSPFRFPLRSFGTRGPCVMTVIMITNMLINANVDAFASYQTLVSKIVPEAFPTEVKLSPSQCLDTSLEAS